MRIRKKGDQNLVEKINYTDILIICYIIEQFCIQHSLRFHLTGV